MICGLDISTSCIGVYVTDADNKENFFYYFKPRGSDWLAKASSVKDFLHTLFLNHEIEKVYVEENLQAFRRGLSSAKTLMALARFNGVVSFMVKDIFSIQPEFLNVNAARKSLGIKIDRKSSLSTKEQVLSWVNGEINHDWPTRVMKSGPRKGMVVLEDYVYDMADAFVIAKAGLVQ